MSLFVRIYIALAVGILICSCSSSRFSKRDIRSSQKLYGLEFTDRDVDTMYNYLNRNLDGYNSARSVQKDYGLFPSLIFDHRPDGYVVKEVPESFSIIEDLNIQLPEKIEEVVFYSIAEQASLIRRRLISSEELTKLYLSRLKKYNDILKCTITITEDLAIDQAQRADREIASGNYIGPLHGIPYGVKDLIAVPGYPTTWGARPYRHQIIDEKAELVEQLEEAGAVLVAKLVSGALARGDVWFGGQTKNPWDTLQGASGSSAGSGSATAAALVSFSIGTETLGSITSPSNRNGVTGLRPTYGSVSRNGVMSLSWSMDKVGPICRSAEDCAIVYQYINDNSNPDNLMPGSKLVYDAQKDIRDYSFAILQESFSDTSVVGINRNDAVQKIVSLNIEIDTIALPEHYPREVFDIILRAESAAMFDDLVRSKKVDSMVQQSQRSRANSLRQARFIPAVEYLQANRIRKMLINDMHELFKEYDVIIAPTFGRQLLLTNLTGHPVITIPTGFDLQGHPTSVSLIGNLGEEGKILEVATAFQKMTSFHKKRPPLFDITD